MRPRPLGKLATEFRTRRVVPTFNGGICELPLRHTPPIRRLVACAADQDVANDDKSVASDEKDIANEEKSETSVANDETSAANDETSVANNRNCVTNY